MSKKEQLKQLHKDGVKAFSEAVKYAANDDEYGYNNAASKVGELSGKFDYLAGDKLEAFEAQLEAKLVPFKCGESDIKNYLEQRDFTECHSCLGIVEFAGLDLID
jgi:hypothetical protein